MQNLSNLDWITHRRVNRSVIDDLFTFQFIELQMCASCNRTTANTQAISILPLPIPRQKDCIALNNCLSTYVTLEHLVGREGLQCSRCQANFTTSPAVPNTPAMHSRQTLTRHQSSITSSLSPIQFIQLHADSALPRESTQFFSSTPLPGSTGSRHPAPTVVPSALPSKVVTDGIRRCLLRRLPECLTMQLLRFSYDTSTKRVHKICTPVAVPVLHVDLAMLTYDATVQREDITNITKSNVYSLYAMCLHIGGESTDSGHYLAYCRAANGCWYRFDDEYVAPITDIEVEVQKSEVQENVYLLFYCKEHVNTSNEADV